MARRAAWTPCRSATGPSQRVPVFPWGDLSSRCTNGNGVLDTEDLNGDNVLDVTGSQRERLPLRREPGGRTASSCGTAWSRRTGKSGGSCTAFRSGSRAQALNTPTLRLVQHLRVTVATPPDAGAAATSSRGWRWPGSGSSARPGCAGRRRRSPASRARRASPTAQISTSVVSTENRTDLGYESPPGVFDNVLERGRRPRDAGHPDQREVAPAHRPPSSGSASAPRRICGSPRARRTCSPTARSGCGCGGGGPGGRKATSRRSSSSGATTTTSISTGRRRRSTTWEPEFVIDLETLAPAPGRCREPLAQRASRPRARPSAARPDTDAYVACDGPVPGARPRPRRQSAQPGRGPGGGGRHLSGGGQTSRPTSPSSGWTTSG